jgi:hypothetical protein
MYVVGVPVAAVEARRADSVSKSLFFSSIALPPPRASGLRFFAAF